MITPNLLATHCLDVLQRVPDPVRVRATLATALQMRFDIDRPMANRFIHQAIDFVETRREAARTDMRPSP